MQNHQKTDLPSASGFLPNARLDMVIKILLLSMLGIYLALSWFTQPQGDDWNNYRVAQSSSLTEQVKTTYMEFGGRFSSVILCHLWLANIDLIKDYWILPVAIQACLLGSLYALIRACVGSIARREAAWWSLMIYVCYTAAMPQPREAYYWATAALIYTPGVICSLLLAATMAIIIRNPASGWLPKLAAILLAGFTCGLHEIMVPAVLSGLALAGAADCWLRRRLEPVWLAALASAGAGSAILVLAPGNISRAKMNDKLGDYSNLPDALIHANESLSSWLTSPLLLSAALLALPMLARLMPCPNRETTARIKPLLVIFLIWLPLMVALFFPPFIFSQIDTPYRLRDLIFGIFLMGGISYLALLIAYLKGIGAKLEIPPLLHYAAAAVFAISLILSSNATRAARDLAVRAVPFNQQTKDRYELMRQAKDSGKSVASIPMISVRPWSLFIIDIQDDEGFWLNHDLAVFFKLDKVRLATDHPTPGHPKGNRAE